MIQGRLGSATLEQVANVCTKNLDSRLRGNDPSTAPSSVMPAEAGIQYSRQRLVNANEIHSRCLCVLLRDHCL
jgi:hypothetical protein